MFSGPTEVHVENAHQRLTILGGGGVGVGLSTKEEPVPPGRAAPKWLPHQAAVLQVFTLKRGLGGVVLFFLLAGI